MKHFAKRITALILVLLMTASLLASCSGGGAGEAQTPEKEENQIPVYSKYKSQEVDLGLTENETVLDIIEVNGELRATIGVAETPALRMRCIYLTEHRYYNLSYGEDAVKREKTNATHEVTFVSDPNVDFVFGGEPFENELQYFLYRDGESLGNAICPPYGIHKPVDHIRTYPYSPLVQMMLYEDAAFVSINCGTPSAGVTYRGELWQDLYVDGHIIDTYAWKPGDPYYTYCGLIGIDGAPYALLEMDGKGRLVPLTPETTELTFEGIDIDGCPTGGAASDGRFGYFMSNTELWRTDGKESSCIVDLTPHGVTTSSGLRSVRALSDGRLLVVIDGKLIELTEADGTEEAVKVCTIGIIDYNGLPEDLNLLIAKYSEGPNDTYFQIKEYDNIANLNLAILSGEIGMVITPNQFALNHYVKQGILAPLEEVAPKLFEKDVLITSIVDAARIDGTCYYLPRYFKIQGENITDPSLLKDGNLFESRQEYYDFITENDPGYFKKATPGELFEVFGRDLDEWIDWETNTAHFDDGTFEAMLEFCNQGGTQDEVDQYMNWLWSSAESQYARDWIVGTFELHDTVEGYRFTDVKKAQVYQESFAEAEGVNWVQVDFPMPSRVHDGYEIVAENFFAVVDHEETRSAAGDFLMWLFGENVDETFTETIQWGISLGMVNFSINKNETDLCLHRLLNAYVDPDEEVAKIRKDTDHSEIFLSNIRTGLLIQNLQCGEEQYEITWDYINNADHYQYANNELFDVMKKEAASYFSGTITAKQAADYVQNRISLYLAEQS